MPRRLPPQEYAAWIELRGFRAWYGLTPAELGRMFHRSPSTIKKKLSGNKRITAIADWLPDKLLLLAAGLRPNHWPPDLPPYPLEPLSERRRRRILKARAKMGAKSYPADPLSARSWR